MPSVPLNFRPPTEPDITKLHIYQATSVAGPWTLVETVTLLPTYPYPDYLTRYTTDLAASLTNWFSIEWEDSKGARSGLSAPIQGGTESLVSVLTERALLRDSSIDENVAAQEAEAIVEQFFPGSVVRDVQPSEATFRMLSGMTLLLLAKVYLMGFLTSTASTDDFTAGLVAMKSSTSSSKRSLKAITDLLSLANGLLGLNYSMKLLLEEIEVAGGQRMLRGVDLTRLLVEM